MYLFLKNAVAVVRKLRVLEPLQYVPSPPAHPPPQVPFL